MTNKAKVEHTYKNVWDKLNKIDLSSQTKKKMMEALKGGGVMLGTSSATWSPNPIA